MSVPTVTVGADDQKAKDIAKPTSAVVNIVWSMSYPVQETTKKGLSTGAIAGIGAGAGIAGIALIALGAWLFVRNWKKKQAGEKGTPPAAAAQAIPQHAPPQQMQPPGSLGYMQPMPQNMQQSHMMMQQPGFVPNGQYSVSTASVSAPGTTTPSDGASLATSMSVSPANEYKSLNNGVYPAPIAEVDEGLAGQQQSGSPPPQINHVPGVPDQGPVLGQQQQQQIYQQTGPISPQQPGPGQQQQFHQQTGPILLPGQPHDHHFPPGTVQPSILAPGQPPQQQMVWNLAAGGYVLAQQQSPPYQTSPPAAG